MTVMINNDADKFTEHLLAINDAINLESCARLWQNIATHYSESKRAYHNLNHLQQLFTQFEQIEQQLAQPNIVALALYYHDVIYDPKRSDNELKSAEYAVRHLQDYLSAEQCRRLHALIIMTADHQLDDSADLDAAYLLDMDLSILGTEWSDYQHYAQAVRQEYQHVTTEDYRIGRVQVLRGLLAHSQLYLTEYYYERLERHARSNIQREISALLEG